jgi:hypothetical protein
MDVKTTFRNLVRDQSVSICMLHRISIFRLSFLKGSRIYPVSVLFSLIVRKMRCFNHLAVPILPILYSSTHPFIWPSSLYLAIHS